MTFQPPDKRTSVKFCHLSTLLLTGTITVLLAACAPLPPRTVSPNFDERRPNLVIIHHTSDNTLEQALNTLTTPERKVSAHYVIGRDGTVVQLVNESARAWHAGISWWGGYTDINSASLGIELDNNGNEPFADAQIDALLILLADIRQRRHIPAANFIGHADIAPSRKTDPSALFPWNKLAERGFGLWCETPLPAAPAGYDLQLALAALGYNPATPEASQLAFRLHFIRDTTIPGNLIPTEQEKAVAYCLLQKKAALSAQ